MLRVPDRNGATGSPTIAFGVKKLIAFADGMKLDPFDKGALWITTAENVIA